MNKEKKFSCMDCKVNSCREAEKEKHPKFCTGDNAPEEDLKESIRCYTEEGEDRKIALTSAEVEGKYYCKLTRAEEIIVFAKKMGYKKIGIACCLNLVKEAQIFAKAAEANGLEVFGAACKLGSIDKRFIGIGEDCRKGEPGTNEPFCNPILQAKLLANEKTEFNVIIGLCVGHDTLFMKYSKAPMTTLITKDRVLGNNPAAALYTSGTYYGRILKEIEIK